MIDTKQVRSVREFQQRIDDYIGQLKQDGAAIVLTVDGRAEVIVQDVESYQRMLDRLEMAEAVAGIRRGMEQFERGEGIPLEEAAAHLRKKHGFSS